MHGLIYFVGNLDLKPFLQLKTEDFFRDWQLHFLGAVKVLQAYLPHLLQVEGSSVVLFSSVAAFQGMPFHASTASCKGAVEALMRSLAAEYAPKVRFNAVAPSLIETKMAETLLNTVQKKESMSKRHPLQRVGTAKDIAEMVLFLLGDKSLWITGQVFHVDGGLSTLKIS